MCTIQTTFPFSFFCVFCIENVFSMFLKPFRVKSKAAIKGSDRKKVRADIGKQFPNLTEDELKSLVPNKEEMSVMKILTHAGENVTAYCLLKNPSFFEVDGVIYPTVYILWHFPDLMPAFATWPPVFSKLQAGADLMLPGVILTQTPSPKMLGNIPKHTPYCIKLFPNKAPVAVGKTALSSNDMFMAAMRGKGVLILHSYKDHLWAHGDKSEPPFLEDNELIEFMNQKERGGRLDMFEEDACIDAEAKVEEDKMLDSHSEHCEDLQPNPSPLQELDMLSIAASAEVENGLHELDEDPLKSPLEIQDELLRLCLLCALKSSIKKGDLPLLTSDLFCSHMLPYCPAGQTLDVKKSSWKKLSKFLQVMEKGGLLKVKQLSKGADSVVEIHRDHPQLKGFTPPEKPDPEERGEAGSYTDRVYQPPQITEMYLVTATCQPLFKLAGHQKGSALTLQGVRQVVTDYVRNEDLKDTDRKGMVVLDPVLTDLVLSRDEVHVLERVSWDELVHRVLAKMSTGFQVTRTGEKPVLKKGKLEPVALNVVQRGGNKKVTLIHNLETFGIEPAEFAHMVQLGVACSTAVNQLPGKSHGSEVLVQGNQVAFVADLLLDKFKVPRKYVQGTEKAPKGKRR